jgi:Mce-associated membrane protein
VDEEVAVPSFRRRASVIDADRVAESPRQDPERSADADNALALAEEAEAEAAEAEALAAAARARAKAIRLRRQALAADVVDLATADAETASVSEVGGTPAETDSAEDAVDAENAATVKQAADAGDVTTEGAVSAEAADSAAPAKRRRVRMPRIRWGVVAAVLAILCISALITLSVLMVLDHRKQVREQQRTAEYAAAARQSVVTLMSLDFNKAKEDVQRIIDNSAGQFKQDFQDQAEDFAKVAQESKVVTEVTVNAAAVKSMTDTGATAIVSATSHVTNSAGAKQEPRAWRLLVELVHDGDQIKMSKVEFVP